MADKDEKKPLITKDSAAAAKTDKAKPKGRRSDLPDYIEEAEPLSTTGKIVLGSVLVACLAAAFALPYSKYRTLMGAGRVLEDIGLDKCRKLDGPSYCEEVYLHKPSGLAFLSCDRYRPIWNPVLGIENEDLLTGNGEIWLQDLNQNGPPKLLSFPNYNASFHPIGITVAPNHKDNKEDSLTLLVVNQPNSDASTVEVFDFKPSTSTLSHLETLTSPHWNNLNRITADNIQWGTTPGGYRLPSFYVNQHHGYSAKDSTKRAVEDLLYLPIGKILYYNARGKETRHSIWRLNNPSGLASDLEIDDGKSVFVASATQGVVERYLSTIVSREHQFEYKFNEHTGATDEVYWPGMIVQETYEWKIVPQGIDIAYISKEGIAPDEPSESNRSIFSAVQADYTAYLAYARAAEVAYRTDPKAAADLEARIVARVPPTVVYRGFRQRVWPNGKPVTPEQEEDEEFDPRFTRMDGAVESVLADAKGRVFRGATGVGVDTKRGKIVVVGAYEKGLLVCEL